MPLMSENPPKHLDQPVLDVNGDSILSLDPCYDYTALFGIVSETGEVRESAFIRYEGSGDPLGWFTVGELQSLVPEGQSP